jgi:UDP-glucose 4-epimerase
MSTNKKYIILGGNGFIGSRLREFLPEKNFIIIGRNLPVPGQEKYKYFSIQQHSLEEIADILEIQPDYSVIDLSYNSISNTLPVHPGKDFSENLNLVIDNLYFAKRMKAVRYIYVSSGGTVYGNTTEKLISEFHPTNPVSHYGIIKLAAEKYVQMYCSQNDLEFQIVRPSNVYGPGQIPFRGQGIISTSLASVFRKMPVTIYGRGDNIRDFIYVDDFCQWLLSLADSPKHGEIYNAGSAVGHSVLDMLDKIRELANGGEKLKCEYAADRPFDVKVNVLDTRKIVQDTKMNCTVDLDEGMKRTWNWIKEHF